MIKLLWWAHLALTIATLISLVSPYFAPDQFWFFSFAGLLYPSFILLHLIFASLWIYFGKKYWILSVLVCLLSYSHLKELVGFTIAPDDLPQHHFSVGVYNLLGGKKLFDNNPEVHAENVADFNNCINVDILVIAETPRYKVARSGLTTGLDIAGLKHHFYPEKSYLTLHSKFPLINPRVVEYFNPTHGIYAAEISPYAKDTFTLVGVHLASNHVRLNPTQILKDAANASKKAYWTIRDIASNYKRGAQTRMQQVQYIVDFIESAKYPVIMAGDLNDTPLSYTFATVKTTGVQDAFYLKGNGLGITYPGTIPGLRIDYVLADTSFQVHLASVVDCNYSDHNATKAQFSWK